MNDLISRQAAIDVLSQYPFEKVVNCISIIEELPSAQPEHTCVNCGRTANNGGWYADGRERHEWAVPLVDIENAPTIEERKSTIEFPHVFIAEGYDSIKSEDGETGFGIYDPENKQIFIAGSVPNEIFVKALLHELMHWVQDISGCAFNEGEANTFAENIYNTMESYIVTGR